MAHNVPYLFRCKLSLNDYKYIEIRLEKNKLQTKHVQQLLSRSGERTEGWRKRQRGKLKKRRKRVTGSVKGSTQSWSQDEAVTVSRQGQEMSYCTRLSPIPEGDVHIWNKHTRRPERAMKLAERKVIFFLSITLQSFFPPNPLFPHLSVQGNVICKVFTSL